MTPRLWIKIDLGGRGQIGPGKIALLEAIAQQRSIAAAARAMNMSYRRAWMPVDEINRTAGRPVVTTHVGGRARGGAELTEARARLIARYRDLQQAARAKLERRLADLVKDLD